MKQINRLNEEISRWAFEIRIENSPDWFIAFTNPTAGPWKTIKAPSLKINKTDEVYRFALEEDRPDIIMCNDKLKCVIIFEAKDSLAKLIEDNQAKKSAEVVKKLAKKMKEEISNDYWEGREKYNIILGLLWGSTESNETTAAKKTLFNKYHKCITDDSRVCQELLIGVETLYKNGKLKCELFYECYSKTYKKMASDIKKSFNL